MFASALGIGQDDWTYLRDQILAGVQISPVTAVRPRAPYGIEYEVRIDVDGRNGETHRVITGWLVAEGGAPRLLTAYVETARRA